MVWNDGRSVTYTLWKQKYVKQPINSVDYLFQGSQIVERPTYLSAAIRNMSGTLQPKKQYNNSCIMGLLNPETDTLDWNVCQLQSENPHPCVDLSKR